MVPGHFGALIAKNGVMGAPSDDRIKRSEPSELARLDRTHADTAVDEIDEFEAPALAAWRAKWAPKCPDGNPQRLRHALAYRERNLCELELRVPLGGDEGGVCQIVVDEREDEVYVRIFVCVHREPDSAMRPRDYIDCPVRVWLVRPLGERVVIDIDTGQCLPLRIRRRTRTIEDGATTS
jgi:hypothetical protein